MSYRTNCSLYTGLYNNAPHLYANWVVHVRCIFQRHPSARKLPAIIRMKGPRNRRGMLEGFGTPGSLYIAFVVLQVTLVGSYWDTPWPVRPPRNVLDELNNQEYAELRGSQRNNVLVTAVGNLRPCTCTYFVWQNAHAIYVITKRSLATCSLPSALRSTPVVLKGTYEIRQTPLSAA